LFFVTEEHGIICSDHSPQKVSIEACSPRSDLILAEDFTEVMPEADAEAPCYAFRKV